MKCERIQWFCMALGMFLFLLPEAFSQNRNTFLDAKRVKGQLALSGGAGVAYYMGDLRDNVDFDHLGLGMHLALGLSYRVHEHFQVRGELRGYQVSGDQQYSKNYRNNLSFRARNPDVFVGVQAELFEASARPFVNPYLLFGGGVTYLRSQAELDGRWESLPRLQTEGVKYNRVPFYLTGGVGFSMRLSDRFSVGLELSNNFLFSDYLDDVSTVYPDPGSLSSDMARRLSDRSPELAVDPFAHTPGDIRGNPSIKDSYLFFGVRTYYTILSGGSARRKREIQCPKF